MPPLVTVVIPVFNGSNYLSDAIDSVLKQTYENYEILVVDDGSTDNTWEIIQSYGDKIQAIRKENGGVSSALNIALNNMKGEWFTWLSHDDLWDSEKLKLDVEYINAHPDVEMIHAGHYNINEEGEVIAKRALSKVGEKYNLYRMFVHGNYVSGISVFINKSCFDKVGLFREDLRCVQDFEMWVRIISKCNVSVNPVTVVRTRVHPKQTGNVIRSHCLNELRRTSISLLKSFLSEKREYMADKYNNRRCKFKLLIILLLTKCHILPIRHSIFARIYLKLRSIIAGY